MNFPSLYKHPSGVQCARSTVVRSECRTLHPAGVRHVERPISINIQLLTELGMELLRGMELPGGMFRVESHTRICAPLKNQRPHTPRNLECIL